MSQKETKMTSSIKVEKDSSDNVVPSSSTCQATNPVPNFLSAFVNSIPDSQTLDPQKTSLHDVVIRHNKAEIERLVPISTNDNKGYYVMTDTMDPCSVFCHTKEITTKTGAKFMNTTFKLVNRTHRDDKNEKEENRTVNKHKKYDSDEEDEDEKPKKKSSVSVKAKEVEQNEAKTPAGELIEKLNTFMEGLTERIKYMMMIPETEKKKSFQLTINTIKLDKTIKYRNIIGLNEKKDNVDLACLRDVLRLCRYRLLLKINYLLVTQKTVLLNMRLVRVLPESLDPLPTTTKLNILSEFNKSLAKSVDKYNELANVVDTSHVSKQQAKDDIKKLLRIPTTVSTTKKYSRSINTTRSTNTSAPVTKTNERYTRYAKTKVGLISFSDK
ncbi:hypothetical protein YASMINEVIRUS_817 [Yasminevirus sp. GU-2018]|uniref:Uncharacterized protein n=1 Tax=Yasminevirus sp. GU-2018 TaxID=2420051 RepID=A0A5K0UA63_9VIRU|nr:hypothetical protein YASMINEVIRUS_817 [Yasminevirus sp. GU-2018]